MGFFGAPARVVTDESRINELLERSVASVIPRDLAAAKLRSGERLRFYLGIDPTGAKLHLGHSVPLRKLKAFGDAGHRIIFLVGSFTAMIGDPSGRDAAREPLTAAQVRENFQTYKRQAQKILDFSQVEVRYNDEWLSPLALAEVVKLASNFTVGQMLERDMFQKRLRDGKPIALSEFLYPLMVGYDSVVLNVDGELGGSDQEFNMLAGRRLQQALGRRDKFVLTTRLIEGLDGRKMSKTYDNAVYLEDEPGEMFGKIMSLKDELVPAYFECVTDMPMGEVRGITGALAREELHPKDAKLRLAREVVSMYHGAQAAKSAEENFTKTFSEGGVPDDAPTVRPGRLRDIVVGISTSELRRLVDHGAVSSVVSGKKIERIDTEIRDDVIRIGKHKFLKVTE